MPKHVEDKKPHSHANRAISEVKSRPVISVPMDINEINYVAKPEAIKEVPDCTAEDKAKTGLYKEGRSRELMLIEEDESDGAHRDEEKEYLLPPGRDRGEQAENPSRVLNMREIEDVRDENKGRVIGEFRAHSVLRELVEEKDDPAQAEIA